MSAFSRRCGHNSDDSNSSSDEEYLQQLPSHNKKKQNRVAALSKYLDDDESSDGSVMEEEQRKPKASLRREVVMIDSSDDEDSFIAEKNSGPLIMTTKTGELIVYDSDDDSDDASTEEADDDEPLITGKMEEVIIIDSESEDEEASQQQENNNSAWAYDKDNDEFYLSSSEYEIDGVTWPPYRITSDLYESLYLHQKIGVQWMASMHSNRIGGILGDDMGLGKTWSSLTYIGGLMRADTIGSALVVAPVSVLGTWEKEAKNVLISRNPSCVRNLKVFVISSTTKRVDRQRYLRVAIKGDRRYKYLVITTYGLVANDPLDFLLGNRGFDYVVLDEAHKIKNDATKVTKSCHRVCKGDNTRRLLLTGTPIQNNLREMWVLFDFATSGRILGPHNRFKKDFSAAIEFGRDKNASLSAVQSAQRANLKLQALVKPHFLQRMKKDIASISLPPKRDFVVWTHLSLDQRKLYEDYVRTSDAVGAVLTGEIKSPLVAVNHLKQLIGHPLLVDERYDRESATLSRLSVASLLHQSAKLEVLVGLISKLSTSGHRTLIFSNSTMTLDIIQRVLEGLNISRIDGSTKQTLRQHYVEEFNRKDSNVDVMLISTKAGGVGLTLTGADRAVIYNPSWNPTDDSQAVDRCYRIGQTRPVEVYRFIAAGTVEEKTYEKQIFKDGINRFVTSNKGLNTERYFDRNELSKLFKLAPEGACELLDSLHAKNRIGDVSSSLQKSFFDDHPGVIGLSSHDAIYEEVAKSKDSESPFGGTTDETTSFKVLGKAQRALDNNSQSIPRKTVTREDPPLKRAFQSTENIRTENSFDERSSRVVSFRGEENVPPVQAETMLPPSKRASPQRFDVVQKVVRMLRTEGRNQEAMQSMLDLLEDQDKLTKEQRLWMHGQISEAGKCIGWL